MTALAVPGTVAGAVPGDRFASPVDAARWGEFRAPATAPPAFAGRVLEPTPGRYHLYVSRPCPASHRLAILRRLAGVGDAVSLSYVDDRRDARGWAFREATGPDPVNGFTLLRDAYLATDAAYAGPVTVPVLWDRATGTVRSNSAVGIGLDLVSVFGDGALHPAALAPAVDAATRSIAAQVEASLWRSVYRPQAAGQLREALTAWDAVLAGRPFVAGDRITDADVRLWVLAVRVDAGPNAHGAVGPRLDAYPDLWRWARRLHELPAFRDTTDLAAISAPQADLPPW